MRCLTNSVNGSKVLDEVLDEFLRWRERSLEAEWSGPLQAANPFTRDFHGSCEGVIKGAGDGTLTYSLALTIAPREDGSLGGAYRLGPWKGTLKLEVLELTPKGFRARGVGSPTALFSATQVGSGGVSGIYYHDGKMTFKMSRVK